MKRPETTGSDISTPDKSEALISLLDEYIDHLEKENQEWKNRYDFWKPQYFPVEFPFRAAFLSKYASYHEVVKDIKSKITRLPETQEIPGELVVVLKNHKQE